MIIKILTAISVLIAFIATRPSKFRITRSILISAPPEEIFAKVNILSKWREWSPWAKLDPHAKETMEGPSSGKGSIMRWSGNQEVGEGSMEIVESLSPELIRIRLDFLKPFKATNQSEFTFTSENGKTRVNWSMSGTNNFMFKAIGLFMNCEKLVGKQFEQGLDNLSAVSEKKQN